MDEAEVKETGDCLLDCARYGDLEDVKYILSESRKREADEAKQQDLLQRILDFTDAEGSTGKHRFTFTFSP